MKEELFAALALMLVLEGILPFIRPRAARQTWFNLSRYGDRQVRIMGLVSMLAGLVLLKFIKG